MTSEAITLNGNKVDVRLFRNCQNMTRCDAGYIGLLGMQVNAGARVILMHPKGTQLEVELTLNNDNGTSRCKLPAVVTNRSNDGMGLTFMPNDPKSNAALMEIILALRANDVHHS